MAYWSSCQCTTGHNDKDGNKTACGLLFRQPDNTRYRDCFECWVKTHPTPVGRERGLRRE